MPETNAFGGTLRSSSSYPRYGRHGQFSTFLFNEGGFRLLHGSLCGFVADDAMPICRRSWFPNPHQALPFDDEQVF
jgi:hypothetical protein